MTTWTNATSSIWPSLAFFQLILTPVNIKRRDRQWWDVVYVPITLVAEDLQSYQLINHPSILPCVLPQDCSLGGFHHILMMTQRRL